MNNLHDILVKPDYTIRDAMQRINRGRKGIALLVDEHWRFLATITDGDLRRAILGGARLGSEAAQTVYEKDGQLRKSVTAPAGISREEQLRIMRAAGVLQLPLVDDSGRVVDLVVADDLEQAGNLPVQAVIMAGGFGTRLRPLTDDTPKPMLPIDGTPILERTIRGLSGAGIQRINITTHYLPEKITNYFGNGDDFGVELNYVSEDVPLGTAGAVGLVAETEEPLLVINGDILTSVDFRSLVKFHRERRAALTVGVRQYDVKVPYGVVEAEDGLVRALCEKPTYDFLVNAGVYLLEPSVRRLIPASKKFDMTDLIELLLEKGEVVASFPILEYWIDIGHHDQLQRAQADAKKLRTAA